MKSSNPMPLRTCIVVFVAGLFGTIGCAHTLSDVDTLHREGDLEGLLEIMDENGNDVSSSEVYDDNVVRQAAPRHSRTPDRGQSRCSYEP